MSFELAAGEWASLVGPSGCGKTTLLMVLGLLDAPDRGTVQLDGVDIATMSPVSRAAARLGRIGFVFQTQNLLDHLTTRDNIALPAWRLGRSRAAALRAADALLERFGLAARARTRASALSTGEAQRAAIARALVNKPVLVLADEPTGSLDSTNAAAILELLGANLAPRHSGAAPTGSPGAHHDDGRPSRSGASARELRRAALRGREVHREVGCERTDRAVDRG